MTEAPRRKRFQIHLSTAVVMMFVAGGIVWANLRQNGHEWGETINSSYILIQHGWPLNAMVRKIEFHDLASRSSYYPTYEMIALDLLVAICILGIVWFVCEWLIRRGAVRKES